MTCDTNLICTSTMTTRPRNSMNKLQSDLADVIWALISCPGFDEKAQDSAIRYGYLNYVAKYSLANDQYLVTNGAYQHLQKLNLVKEKGLRRGSKSKVRQFTYEHPIPCNVVADEILINGTTKARMLKILEKSDCVTVLTQDENKRLSGKLLASMPTDWRYASSPTFARYAEAGLPSGDELTSIKVYGAIAR